MLRHALSIAIFVALASATHGAEWICIPDKSTGFFFENGSWDFARFNVEGQSLVVAEVAPYADFIDPTQMVGAEVTVTGDEHPMYRCPPLGGREQIACGGLGWGFVFNTRTLRFMTIYTLGYVDEGDSADNTPSLTIGKCIKLPGR